MANDMAVEVVAKIIDGEILAKWTLEPHGEQSMVTSVVDHHQQPRVMVGLLAALLQATVEAYWADAGNAPADIRVIFGAMVAFSHANSIEIDAEIMAELFQNGGVVIVDAEETE